MGKGGGSQTRPVFDYHLSIDYGICMGPIDHLNKVWIKDKTIFCGLYHVRTDVTVNLPELFGGGDAEGGVSGVCEIYTGSDNQLSSWELTKRFGLTPLDAPGYRGMSHLFFRGPLDQAVIDGEIDEADDPDGLIYQMKYTLTDQVGDTIDPSTSSTGWKWTSNNPYLPEARVAVTRLPKSGYADPYAAIWPPARIDGNGNLAGLESVNPVLNHEPEPVEPQGEFDIGSTNGGSFDLYEFGHTQAEIDAGVVSLTTQWTITAISYETYRLTSVTLTSEVRFYSAPPVDGWDSAGQIAPVSGEEALASQDDTQTPSMAVANRESAIPVSSDLTSGLSEITVPVGARYVRVRSLFTVNGSFIKNVTIKTPAETGNYHDEWLFHNPNDPRYTPASYGTAYLNTYEGDIPGPDPDPPEDTYVAPPNNTDRPVLQGPFDLKTTPPTKLGIVIDLIAAGFTEEEIDDGYIWAQGSWTGVTYQGVSALPDGSSIMNMNFSCHATKPVNWYDSTVTDPLSQTKSDGSSGATHSLSVAKFVLPPNTRFLQIRLSYTTAVGMTTEVTGTDLWMIGYDSYDAQWCATDDLLGPLPDANPARIIYDCLTDPEWGKGEDPAMIDDASFNTCAQTLYNERFGLSFAFFEQDNIENFISEVLDHIQGFLYLDPATGLWTVTLLRDDYDADAAPLLDESNCDATDRKRRLWGETINEIVVSYMDRNTEKPTTVAAQDLGNIAIQGGVISETREYYGIRNPLLAQYVAQRDVRAAGYPLFSCTIKVSRAQWAVRPGDVYRFSWAEDGITEVVVRVMSVDYGKPSDRTITLQVTEDIFAIERAQYEGPQTTEWVNVEQPPSALDAQAAFTAPLPSLIRAGLDPDDIDADYPVVVGTLYADEDGGKPSVIEVQSAVTRNNGTTNVQKITEIVPTYSSILMTDLPQEAESTLRKSQIDAILRRNGVEGEFFMLWFTERFSEIIMLDSYDSSTKLWTVKRGMWDTVPLAWPAGVRLWYMLESLAATDPRSRNSGEEVTYYLLPRTSLGRLDFDEATPLTVTYTDRPFAPFRPADAQLDGQGFGGVVDRVAPYPTEFEATWKNRNRLTEDQVSLSWDDASVTVEAGQTVTLRILDDLGNTYDEITGLTGESHTISAALLPPSLEGYIEFLSERDGYVSVFGARRYFDIRPPSGYGLAYGLDYGGEQ